MTRQSKQDMHSEGGKPHHPLKISRILQISEHRGKNKINNFLFLPDFKLKMLSYHFPPKVVPSWLHAGFKRLSVCIGWKLNERAKYEEKKNTFSVIKYKIALFLCVVGEISLVLECRCGIINKCRATRDLFSPCGINTDIWSLRGLHSFNSSPFTLWHRVHVHNTLCCRDTAKLHKSKFTVMQILYLHFCIKTTV